MMRPLMAVLLVSLAFSGCFGDDDEVPDDYAPTPDVGYDARELRVTEIVEETATITGFGGVNLAATIVYPVSPDTVDGGPARFPVVLMANHFMGPHTSYQNWPLGEEGLTPPRDLMADFARAGIITVGFDARGWFQSDGTTNFAGPQEIEDIRAIINFTRENYDTNSRFGFTGVSYSGGLAALAWEQIDEIVTAVPMGSWGDLSQSIMPGNVPKLEFAAFLAGLGTVGTGVVGVGDEIPRWTQSLLTRQGIDDTDSEMDQRSVSGRVDKPIMTCMALGDTFYGDAHLLRKASSFSRALYIEGAHMTQSMECWDRAIEWFLFWLAGVDTGINSWPALKTVDASGTGPHEYKAPPPVTYEQWFLGEPDATMSIAPANATFTIGQRLVANPLHEPSLVWDLTNGIAPMSNFEVPAQLRQDPTGAFFSTPTYNATQILIGAPHLRLVADEAMPAQWQVVATLYHEADGTQRLLGRTAYAVLEDGDHDNGTVDLTFPWTHTQIKPDESLVIKLASNDPTIFAPLLANYEVTFTGDSTIWLPLFDPEPNQR